MSNETWWISQEQLSKEQLAVIDLDPAQSHVILGPPGSGKTNLLLLRANYLYLGDQKNLEVLVFTRTLHRFLSSGGREYSFPDEKVKTLTKWQIDLLRLYSVPIPEGDSFEDRRLRLGDAIEELTERRNLADLYECLLLDEAHDYTPKEIKMLRRLSKRIFAVADARQKIYSTPDCMDTLTNGIPSVHTLKYHYRIGRKICIVADGIARDTKDYVPLLPTCNYDEVSAPSRAMPLKCDSLDDQVEQAVAAIELQIKTYPGEMMGVLCPTNDVVNAVWDRINSSPIAEVSMLQAGEEHPYFPDTARVSVSTIHSAKGLEFRAVHVLGADQLKRLQTNRRNVAFTAVTRAKSSLSVYYSNQLEGFLEQALAAVQPLSGQPGIQAAFGPGRTPRS